MQKGNEEALKGNEEALRGKKGASKARATGLHEKAIER